MFTSINLGSTQVVSYPNAASLEKSDYFTNFSPELLEKIFIYLKIRHKRAVVCVNTYFHSVILNQSRHLECSMVKKFTQFYKNSIKNGEKIYDIFLNSIDACNNLPEIRFSSFEPIISLLDCNLRPQEEKNKEFKKIFTLIDISHKIAKADLPNTENFYHAADFLRDAVLQLLQMGDIHRAIKVAETIPHNCESHLSEVYRAIYWETCHCDKCG